MALDFDSIPDSDAVGTGEPSAALRDLRSTRPGRRGVLKGITLSGLTVGATALSVGAGTSRAAAETSPTGLTGWDRNDCADAYPRGYQEMRDTSGEYVGARGACFGGSYVGSDFCDAQGWHRSDSQGNRTFRPVSGSCSGKNSWRWTVDGVTYRCSDGRTTETIWWFFTRSYLTICRAAV